MAEPAMGAGAPRLAASLLLVRDAPALQVLMVERHRDNAVGPGALVFPGGKLEAQDDDHAWTDAALGWTALDAHSRSLRICAIRETYEETSIILAQPRARAAMTVDSGGEDALERSHPHLDQPSPFLAHVRRRDLILDLEGLTPFARWITPHDIAARFDASFFIAPAPEDQLAASDGFETVSAEWIEPLHALELAARGERTLMPPTRVDLKRLGESRCVADAVAAARTRNVQTEPSSMIMGPNGYVPTLAAGTP